MSADTTETAPVRAAKVGASFEVTERWACSTCGEVHEFGVYVAAHWHVALWKTCDCGTKTVFREGIVEDVKFSTPTSKRA